MKRFLSLILTLVLALNFSLISGSLGFDLIAKAEETEETEEAEGFIPEPVDLTSREDFSLGINVHAKSYAAYPEAYLEEQIHAVARMGSKWIRMNGTIPEDGDWSYLDTAVGLCNKYGLKIVMVIYPSLNVSLDYITLVCETFAYRYNGEDGRGYVDIFQVLNEVDITLLRAKYGGSSPGGETESQYYTIPVDGAADLPEYLEYFQAAEKGIHSKDSNSKFMINFSARHCGMITYFLRNGLKLDVVGWDLYTNKPHNRVESVAEMQSAYDMVEENIYKKYNVPVMLCETNVHVSMLSKEERQNAELSSYETLLDNLYLAYNRPWIKAAILYELLDEPAFGSDSAESSFGLIKNDTSGSGVLDVENEKPIYRKLQNLIGGNRDLPIIKRSEIDLKPYEKLVVGTADDSEIGKDDNTSSDTTSSDATVSGVTSSDNDVSNVTSSENTSSKVTSSENTSSKVTSSNNTSSKYTSSNKTSSKDTSSNKTSSKDTSSKTSILETVNSEISSSSDVDSSSSNISSDNTETSSKVTVSEQQNTSSESVSSQETEIDTDIETETETESQVENSQVDNTEKDTVSKEPEKVIEEVIVENVITPIKDIKSTETSYKMPWVFVICMSAGMLVLAGGIIVVYIILSNKKLRK